MRTRQSTASTANSKFAVSSERSSLQGLMRKPFDQVRIVPADGLEMPSNLGALALKSAAVTVVGDIDVGSSGLPDLHVTAPHMIERLVDAIDRLDAHGGDRAQCRGVIEEDFNFLCCRGASFHNDISGHWTSCLFWVMALEVVDVEVVFPQVGLSHRLSPGDIVIFDPCLVHGVCRTGDGGRMLASSFEHSAADHQAFLSGEIELSGDQWAALGCPWLPADDHMFSGALDLSQVGIDEETGALTAFAPRD